MAARHLGGGHVERADVQSVSASVAVPMKQMEGRLENILFSHLSLHTGFAACLSSAVLVCFSEGSVMC